jgi:hypothetical protein
MKSILDPSFQYTSSLDTDLKKTFQRVWRELYERSNTKPNSDFGQSKVEVKCNGELADIGAVGGKDVADLVRTVYVCPRCDQRHPGGKEVPRGSLREAP